MRKTVFFIAALFFCTVARAQYFCPNNGTELHYVNYDDAGQSISETTVSVRNVTEEASKLSAQYFAKIVTNKEKNNTSYTLYDWTYEEGNTVCTEDLMYGPYIDSDSDPKKYDEKARESMREERKFKGDNAFTLRRDAKAGETMPDRSYSLVLNMLKNDVSITGATYMGDEQVSTRAGKFSCVKISYLKRTKILLKSETLRIVEWYAEGIGLVKSESFNTKGEPEGKTLLVKIVK